MTPAKNARIFSCKSLNATAGINKTLAQVSYSIYPTIVEQELYKLSKLCFLENAKIKYMCEYPLMWYR